MPKKIILTVVVRLKSERLHKKALLMLHNKTVLEHLYIRVKESKLVSKIIFCTSEDVGDDPIEKLGIDLGVEVFRGHRENVLSRLISVADIEGADAVIRVTGDNPLTDPQLIDEMITSHFNENAEYTYNDELPRGTRSEVISTAALKKCMNLVQDANSSEYLTPMIKRKEYFKVNRCIFSNKKYYSPDLRLTLDTAEDFLVLSKIYEHYLGIPPNLDEIIEWLKNNPNVPVINNHIEPKDLPSHVNVLLRGDASAYQGD